jgi:hypothetical protein
MKTLDQLTASELEKVASLKRQIEAIFSGKPATPAKAVVAAPAKPKRKMSAAAKKKIGAAQTARWAKIHKEQAEAAKKKAAKK